MKKIDVLITSCENGVLGEVGCHFSPSGSNNKNKNNSPMLIPIIFPEAIMNKCIVIVFVYCIQFSQLNDYTSRICPSIRDRLRRCREAFNAVTLRDDNRPKIKNLMCCGGVCVTVRVPVAFRNKCERVTGPQPGRVRSIFARVNATRTSGTGPEQDQNANRNRCEHGLRLTFYLIVGFFH